MLAQTRGITLRTLKYNDSSIIVEMYTLLWGRASFLVTLPKQRNHPLKPVLFQPLSITECVVNITAHSTLYRIKEAKALKPFCSIPYNPYKTSLVLYIAEFLYRAIREEGCNEALYHYLEHSITWLDEHEGQFANFHLVLLIGLSRYLGIYPNLDCYHHGDWFDLLNACFTPTPPNGEAYFLAPTEAERVIPLTRMRYHTMRLFPMSRAQRTRCLEVINDYYRLHIPDFPKLKSADILKELYD